MRLIDTTPSLLGYWALASDAPFCLALRFFDDEATSGERFLRAEVLHWAPGTTGCMTTSSDIGVIPGVLGLASGSHVRISIELFRPSGEASDVEFDLDLSADRLDGAVTVDKERHRVALSRAVRPFPDPDSLPRRSIVG